MPTIVMAGLDTPLGVLRVISRDDVLLAATFSDRHVEGVELRCPDHQWVNSETSRPYRALARYFNGELDAVVGLDVDPGGTDFQKAVWTALLDIPVGAVESYGDLAKRVGNPKASRAVGAANGRNPIPIVIPCHRVIGSDGSLTGYGSGVDKKKWLLAHEGVEIQEPRQRDLFAEAKS